MSKSDKSNCNPKFGINIRNIQDGFDCWGKPEYTNIYDITYKGHIFYTTRECPDELIGYLESFLTEALAEERKKYENKNNDSYSYLRDLSYRKLVNRDNEKNVTDVILNTYKIYKGNQFIGEVVEEPKELVDNLNKFCK